MPQSMASSTARTVSASSTAPNSFPSGEAPKPMRETCSPVAPRALRCMLMWLRNGLDSPEEKNVPANPDYQDDRCRTKSPPKRVRLSCKEAGRDGRNHSSDLIAEIQDSTDLTRAVPRCDQGGDRPADRRSGRETSERNTEPKHGCRRGLCKCD